MALSACFSSVDYACEDDAQCRVGQAQGVCVDPGFCAYEDGACDSGLRFGPFAGSQADACVELEDSTGFAETSTQTTDATDPTQSTTSSSGGSTSASSSETGCTEDCGDVGEVLWVAEPDHAAVLRGVTTWNGELVAVGDARGVEHIGRYAIADGSLIAAAEAQEAGIAWDVAAMSSEAIAVVGERPGTLGTRAIVVAYSTDFQPLWSDPFESAAEDAMRATTWASGRLVSAGTRGGQGFVVGHDIDGVVEFDPQFIPDGASEASFFAVAPGPGGVSLGGRFDASGWLVRFVGTGSTMTPARALPLTPVAGVASLGPNLDVVVGGEGYAVVDADGPTSSNDIVPGGEMAAVAALPSGGWIAAGRDARGRPWFTVRDAASDVVEDGVIQEAAAHVRDIVVTDGVAYVVGGTDGPLLAAVRVGE